MKNIIFSIAFAATLACNVTQAQPVMFQKEYGLGTNCQAVRIIQTADGAYAIAERDENGVSYFFKIDPFGDVLWSTTCQAFGMMADQVEQTADGGLVFLSSSLNGTTVFYDLTKTDASGIVQWSQEYKPTGPNHQLEDSYYWGSGNITITLRVKQTDDHGYILMGQTWDTVTTESQFQLIKTDSLGQVTWEKDYDEHEKSWLSDMDIVRKHVEGDSIVGYIFAAEYIDTAAGFGTTNVLLTRVDNSGNIVWSTAYSDSAFEHVAPFSIQHTSDDGFIVTGKITPFGSNPEILLMKVNGSGNLQWSKRYVYPPANMCWGNTVKQTLDGGYIIGGCMKNLTNDHAILLKTDAAGNLLWLKRPYNVWGSDAVSVIQTADSGYAFCGQIYLNSTGYLAYIVKTDSIGNSGCYDSTIAIVQTPVTLVEYSTGSSLATSVSDSLGFTWLNSNPFTVYPLCLSAQNVEFMSGARLNFYPNPTQGILLISNILSPINQIDIYSLLGKKVFSVTGCGPDSYRETTVDCGLLSPGIYILQATSGEKTWRGKVVKE